MLIVVPRAAARTRVERVDRRPEKGWTMAGIRFRAPESHRADEATGSSSTDEVNHALAG